MYSLFDKKVIKSHAERKTLFSKRPIESGCKVDLRKLSRFFFLGTNFINVTKN